MSPTTACHHSRLKQLSTRVWSHALPYFFLPFKLQTRFVRPARFVGTFQCATIVWIYLLRFHPLPHSLRTMEIRNPFAINHFCTLSHAMEGGLCTVPNHQSQILPRTLLPARIVEGKIAVFLQGERRMSLRR